MINVKTIIHSQCPFISVELGLVAVRCGVAPEQLAFIYLLATNFADIILLDFIKMTIFKYKTANSRHCKLSMPVNTGRSAESTLRYG